MCGTSLLGPDRHNNGFPSHEVAVGQDARTLRGGHIECDRIGGGCRERIEEIASIEANFEAFMSDSGADLFPRVSQLWIIGVKDESCVREM